MFKQNLHQLLEKPERVFLIIGSLFGLLSVFMMPALTIPDEGAHFWMSYGMFSKNQQIPRDLVISAEDSTSYTKDGTYIDKVFKTKANLEGDTTQFNYSRSIVINSVNDTRTVSSLDISRIPQAVGVAIGKMIYPSVGVMSTVGRLFNLAFFIAAIYFVIKRVRYGKLAITFLALFPMIIHQAGSMSYDVINIVAVFAWVGLMLNLFMQATSITKKQIAKIILIGAVLVATKPTNAILLGFLPFLPSALYKNTNPLTRIRALMPRVKLRARTIWIFLGIIAVPAVVFAALVADAYLNIYGISSRTFVQVLFNTFFQTNINTQLDPIVTTGIVGHFGWLWYKLPEWLVFVHLSVFGLILLGQKVPQISRRFAIVSLSLFVLSIAAIVLGMYFLWTLDPKVAGPGATFIQGMQGRYFTPLLILLVPVFAYLQKYINVKINQKLLVVITITTAIFSLTVYMLLTYTYFYLPA